MLELKGMLSNLTKPFGKIYKPINVKSNYKDNLNF